MHAVLLRLELVPLRSLVVLAFLAALGASALVPAGPLEPAHAAAGPTAPILIEGDEALCAGPAAVADNCASADGSAARPYRIDGRTIAVGDQVSCSDCAAPVSCTDGAPAAIAICGLTKHLVLSNLTLTVSAHHDPARGLYLRDVAALRLEDGTLRTSGIGIVGTGGDTPSRLVLERVSLGRPDTRPPAPETTSVRPLIHATDIDLVIRDSGLDADGRQYAVRVDRGDADRTVSARIETSRLTGATTTAVSATDTDLYLFGNHFQENGLHGAALHDRRDDPTGAIGNGTTSAVVSRVIELLASIGRYELVGNQIEVRGAGVYVEGNATGLIQGNRFYRATLGINHPQDEYALFFAEDACFTTTRYNDFVDGLSVVHGSFVCELDATYNWWGGVGGPRDPIGLSPQTIGPIKASPWLHIPLEGLPLVQVEGPEEGAKQGGTVLLHGTATGVAANPVERIEVTPIQDVWNGPLVAEGGESWRLRIDLAGHNLGPLRFWVRACGPVECGMPVSLGIEHEALPLPPVALLAASPRLVHPGEPVTLDGGASYSPAGTPITAYRFHLEGLPSSWTNASTHVVSFDKVGLHRVGLEVRDQQGRMNSNPAELVIRVLPEGGDLALQERLPAPAIPLVVLSILLVLQARRRCA